MIEALCRKLMAKHAKKPVILFLDENDISFAQHLTSQLYLRDLSHFHFISAFSPIVENVVRLKISGFDFEDKDISIEDEERMWVNLYLRYRNTTAIQNLCRELGKSLK